MDTKAPGSHSCSAMRLLLGDHIEPVTNTQANLSPRAFGKRRDLDGGGVGVKSSALP